VTTRKQDVDEAQAREMCVRAGGDPDDRVPNPHRTGKTMPGWCAYRAEARDQRVASDMAEAAAVIPRVLDQPAQYRDAPWLAMGEHDANTIAQMKNCMTVGNVVGGVLCADGHLGYSQPVGGVIAYESQVSISGVGYDIACGNMAVRLDTRFSDIRDRVGDVAHEIGKIISFGVGRTNDERVNHALFDDTEAWREADRVAYLDKARAQLGTVGSGNHYVDLMRDPLDHVWIGVHFGSRGLGHTSATKYLKAAGGRDGINELPTVVDEGSEVGVRYVAAMELAGRYARAGREWVIERVRQIVGGSVVSMVHNHHNYAWRERHGDRDLWVVRKGATPAFPGQQGFVGGSMCDEAVIVEGIDSDASAATFRSTVHGAGRLFGRREARRRFTHQEMGEWLDQSGVTLVGAGLDESPMAYRRLATVLHEHRASIDVIHRLTPFVVVMAGDGEHDPFKD
jgi:tRNA-splicing ligase RtcB (3'-phosphate/5'-hydroxy nucleic acid ligase)